MSQTTESVPQAAPDEVWTSLHDGDKTHADYAEHYAAYSDKYHPLLRPIVERVLAEQVDPDEQAKYNTARKILEDILSEDYSHYIPDGKLEPAAAFRRLLNDARTIKGDLRPNHVFNSVVQEYDLSAETASQVKVAAYTDLLTVPVDGEYYGDADKNRDEQLKTDFKVTLPLNESETEKFKQSLTDYIKPANQDWDYVSLPKAYQEVKQLAAENELDPAVIDTWRTNAAKNYLGAQFDKHSEHHDHADQIRDQLSGVDITAEDQTKLMRDEYLGLLSHGQGISANNLRKELIPAEEFDLVDVRTAAEAGIKTWADNGDNSADDLWATYKAGNVPLDFVQQPAVYEKIAKGLGSNLYGYDNLSEVKKLLDDIPLPAEATAIIDEQALEVFEPTLGLLKFVGDLNKDDTDQRFPLVYAKALASLNEELETNEDVADYFLENIEKFAADQPWLQQYMLNAVSHYSVANKFVNVIKSEPAWTKQAWYPAVLAAATQKSLEPGKHHNDDEFGNDDGDDFYSSSLKDVQDTDPYGEHRWQFGPEQVKVASALIKLMRGKPTDAALQSLGLEKEDHMMINDVKFLLNRHIDRMYAHMGDIGLTPELQNKEGRDSSLLINTRGFMARYIAQSIDYAEPLNDELDRLSTDIGITLYEGIRAYKEVLNVDVPLYDKLYEEFDDLRANGRKPMEVYLGRDGIYAWIGRRAQDAARRRTAVEQGWSRSEILEIHPKYVVYPRYFRDNMSREAQREYLEQADVSIENDPIFYDTGYTGTIPEQMMQVMGFSSDEIEERIRLLSADRDNRRVRGISENARGDIIEKIEYNAKLHNSAEGMVRDGVNGEIRPIAQPTSPRQQFKFLMIQQAISRHYWYKERQAGKSADVRAPRELQPVV